MGEMRKIGEEEDGEQRKRRIRRAEERKNDDLLEAISDAEDTVRYQRLVAKSAIAIMTGAAIGQVVDQSLRGILNDYAIVWLSFILWILFVGSIIVGTVWFFAIETSEKASPRKRLRNARKDYQKFVTGQTTYRIDY